MAYNEYLAEKINRALRDRKVHFEVKKMMGGLCYMVDDKMCIGVTKDLLMARIGEEESTEARKREGCKPMDFTGRPMKGFVFVDSLGWDLDDELDYYIDKSLAFNPFAKSSKRKKK